MAASGMIRPSGCETPKASEATLCQHTIQGLKALEQAVLQFCPWLASCPATTHDAKLAQMLWKFY